MPDVSHLYGGDLQISATGDLAVVDGLDMTTQRIIRRLMTIVQGYIWHLDYGAGVEQQIGRTLDEGRIMSLITSQIYAEKSVAPNPPPQISISADFESVTVTIVYWSSLSGQQETLSFSVNS